MRNIYLLIIVLLSINFTNAQVFNSSKAAIGIDEQLGNYIPMDLKFSNEKGDTVTLGSLIDKPTVLSFVYFDCPSICSPLQQGISEVIERSNLEIGKDYNVITISFNYRDDPIKAKKKKKNFVQRISKDKSEYWSYLTSDSATINSILAAVGYKVKVTGLDFAHPSGIVLVSPKGMITRYLYGLEFLPLDFKMAVYESAKGLPRPTISKVLEYCFAYDPEGKKYSLQVTKIAATIIIFLSLILLTALIINSRRKGKSAGK